MILPPCPECRAADTMVIRVRQLRWQDPPVTKRRHGCRECGHRWTTHLPMEESVRQGQRQDSLLGEDAIREILTSPLRTVQMAERYQVSSALIGRIRRRELYTRLCPDLGPWPYRVLGARRRPGTPRRICSRCRLWDEQQCQCSLRYPDADIGERKAATCPAWWGVEEEVAS